MSNIWPNNPWYEAFQKASPGVPLYFPNLNIGGSPIRRRRLLLGPAPKGESINAKISQQHGSHYLKAGLNIGEATGSALSPTLPGSISRPLSRQTPPVIPNTLQYGQRRRRFLLGAMDPDATQMIGGPAPDPHIKYLGMFIQDDWKLKPQYHPESRTAERIRDGLLRSPAQLSRGLDLNAPFPRCRRIRRNAGAGARARRAAATTNGTACAHWTGRQPSERDVGSAEIRFPAPRGNCHQDQRQDGVSGRLRAIRHSNGVGVMSRHLRFRDGQFPVAAVLRRDGLSRIRAAASGRSAADVR